MGPGSGRILPSFLPLAVTSEVLLVKMCWICQQKWLDSGRSRKLDRAFYMPTAAPIVRRVARGRRATAAPTPSAAKSGGPRGFLTSLAGAVALKAGAVAAV